MMMTLHIKKNRSRRELMRIMLRYLADGGPASITHLIYESETNHRSAIDIFAELENIGAIKKIPKSYSTISQAKYFYEITNLGRKILQEMDMLAGLINV